MTSFAGVFETVKLFYKKKYLKVLRLEKTLFEYSIVFVVMLWLTTWMFLWQVAVD
jgi:hypothetical protein